MDSTTGGVLGIFGILISGGSVIYAAINHKRIRCRCCGKDLDISVDVDPTIIKKKKKTSATNVKEPEEVTPDEETPEETPENTIQQEEEEEIEVPVQKKYKSSKVAPYQ
jgi:hypothetical protein